MILFSVLTRPLDKFSVYTLLKARVSPRKYKWFLSCSMVYARKHCVTSISCCWRSKAHIGNAWYSLVAQKGRSNRRRKRKTQLHQLERSSQSDKTCIFTTAIHIHHTGCLLGAFYSHSCDSVLAKNHANAVLSATRQSSSFVWLDSCTLCVLWQLDRWEI